MLSTFTYGQLFHYTTKERAIEDIFHGMTIRMGPMRSTNDPRETDPWFFGFSMDDEGEPDGDEFVEISRRMNAVLKGSCVVACFAEDAPDVGPGGYPDRYRRREVGVQGYAHDRMWAQYAGNHTGVCILFDREKLVGRIKKHFRGRVGHLLHGSVDYVSRFDFGYVDPFFDLSWREIRRMGIEEFAKDHRRRFARQLYLTKNPDWASEQEYRFVWVDEGEGETEAEYVSIDDCVSAICLGARFPEVYEDNMLAIRERLDTSLYRVVYMFGELQVVPAF